MDGGYVAEVKLPPDIAPAQYQREFIAKLIEKVAKEAFAAGMRAGSGLARLDVDDAVGISISQIKRAVSEHYSLPLIDLTSDRRSPNASYPRFVAIYLARQLTKFSLPAIGHNFGNRDHATVRYAIQKVEQRMKTDADLRQSIHALRARLTRVNS